MELNRNLNFQEFPIPSYEEWKDEAIKSLKGASFEKKLFTSTFEDIILKPIYYSFDVDNDYLTGTALPGAPPFLRGNTPSGIKLKKWDIAQTIPYYETKTFNAALKVDLANGQNAVSIHINRNEYFQFEKDAVVCGTRLRTHQDIENALEGIDLEKHSVYFNSGDFFVEFVPIFKNFVSGKNIETSKIKGNLGADPLTESLINGGSKYSTNEMISNLSEAFNQLKSFPNFGIITINGAAYHNSGANSIQELAYSFANAIELINGLIDQNLTPEEIFPKIRFHFAISSDFFMQIAKIRAARLIWAKIVKEYGLGAEFQKLNLHCSTSIINKTKYDPWVNILRSSIECLAAILVNADSIDVGNFDFAYGYPSEFSRRISRNIQLILQHEAHILDTIDPVAGSYYLENITNELAQKTWSAFQGTQSEGGFLELIRNGVVQKDIANSYAKQDLTYQSRKQILLGTNKYPLLKEKHPSDCEPFVLNTLEDNKLTQKSFDIKKIYLKRFASNFESLRLNAENYLNQNGNYPIIVLLNFGELNEWKPRNDFSSDFLQVGGFEIISSPAMTDKVAAIEFLNSQATNNIVCICSSDIRYEELIPELVPLIKKNHPLTYVILAGHPEDKVEEYKSFGVDCFIHIKANVYDTLKEIQKINNII